MKHLEIETKEVATLFSLLIISIGILSLLIGIKMNITEFIMLSIVPFLLVIFILWKERKNDEKWIRRSK